MAKFKVTFDNAVEEEIQASAVKIEEPWVIFSDTLSGASHLLRTRDVKRIDKVHESTTSDND